MDAGPQIVEVEDSEEEEIAHLEGYESQCLRAGESVDIAGESARYRQNRNPSKAREAADDLAAYRCSDEVVIKQAPDSAPAAEAAGW